MAGLHLMQVAVARLEASPGEDRCDRILIAENRCALFVSTVSLAHSLCAGCRPPGRNADPHPYMTPGDSTESSGVFGVLLPPLAPRVAKRFQGLH